MIQVIPATFKDGVFKPDQRPALADSARVRLLVEQVDENADESVREQAWDSLERAWQQSTFNSHGERLTREQLHERR